MEARVRRPSGRRPDVLVSSHLLTEMEVLADALVIIAAGNLVAHGTLEQILTSSGTGVVVHVRTPNVTELTTAVTGRGGTVTATNDGRLRITGVSAAAVGNAAAAIGVELHDLRTHKTATSRSKHRRRRLVLAADRSARSSARPSWPG